MSSLLNKIASKISIERLICTDFFDNFATVC